MARKIYTEKPSQVYAAQYKGDNVADLEEIAPGKIIMEEGRVFLETPTALEPVPINLSDWVMDDPIISFPTAVSNASFSARFNLNL